MTTYSESVLIKLTERQARLLRLAAEHRGKTIEQLAKSFCVDGIENYAAHFLSKKDAK